MSEISEHIHHAALRDGETLIESFSACKNTYIREHIMLAAIGSVALTGFLMYNNNPDPWVGVVASIAGIAVRGFYVFKEQMGMIWHLTDQRLLAPDGRSLPLSKITKARRILSGVQVVAENGDKYFMKYMGETDHPIDAILAARDARGRL